MDIGNEKIKESIWSKLARHKGYFIAIGIILLYALAKNLITKIAVPVYGYDGEYLYSIETNVGKRIMDPPAITEMPGYSIVWYDNPEGTGYDISFPYYVERGIQLYPQLLPIKYAIYFDSMGGSAVWSILREYGYPVAAPPSPHRAGFTFAGWYADHWYRFEYEFTTMPYNGITLYARWIPIRYT
ncbi:MAG: InlB B-repeat-containing protein, partial [bacterium]